MDVFLLLPNVRSLVLSAWHEAPLHFRSAYAERANPFHTIKRLAVHHVFQADFSHFAAWIRECAAAVGGLRLTHFKLTAGLGLARAQIQEVLSALAAAPLRMLTLALEVVLWAEPELLECISEMCPEFEALTLLCRENALQTQTKACVWLPPTWTYAPHLAGLRRPLVFAWNFYIEPPREHGLADLERIECSWRIARR
ncbi:hypothetical protein CERSUDRAFT_117485 [Gelatoporia subvermispora B]|uniref:F-box domain-containing protein n=1 Tax=Ceriporiopsis subvermispora (strain B) TaxID=914234 RepID=M2R4Z4_CERS8|nr:hypothetical protein CERSUDRAFT_117485 [Gelatoporia subvermispora B]